MIKIQTISFIVVIILLGYSLYNNEAVLFFSSLMLFPLIIIVKSFHTNGLPKIRVKNKLLLQVKTVRKTRKDIINEILLGVSIFKKFNDYFGIQYSKDIEPSGESKIISEVSIKNLKIVLFSLLFSIIFSIVLYFVTYTIVSFLFLLLPVGIYMLNRFELRTPITQRKNGIEKELLFFCIFCDIMDRTQSKLYHTFKIITHDDSGLFPWIKKEGVILQRDVTDGNSPLVTLRNLASIHPSKLFTEFIQGYLTSQLAGGRDTGNYLAEKTREYHILLKQKMSSYVETSDSITQMVSFGLIMYPIMIVLSSTMTTGNNIVWLIIFGFFLIPIVIFILIKKIESISPFPPDHIPLYKIPIILSATSFLVCIIVPLQYWECLIFPLMVWSIVNHIMIRKQLVINHNIDQSIPRFVRDINQNMLSGSNFLKSFHVIQEKKSYTAEFNQILEKIKQDVHVGEQVNSTMLNIHTTSHLSKLIIRIISYAGNSGEITAHTMEKLAIFSNNYLESKAEINNKTTISVMLSYFGSLIVVVLVIMIPAYNMDNFTVPIEGINNVSLDDTLTSLNLMLVIVTSFLSMILVSKIRYGTIKHSIHNGIVLCMILVILYYDGMVGLNVS